jgi:hypothetical protein
MNEHRAWEDGREHVRSLRAEADTRRMLRTASVAEGAAPRGGLRSGLAARTRSAAQWLARWADAIEGERTVRPDRLSWRSDA